MTKKRLLSLLLCVVMLCGATACSENAQSDGAGETTGTAGTVAGDVTAETQPEETEAELSDNLPERDYEGATFSIWGDIFTYDYFYNPELTGDVINDAVYNRNTELEERFNVKFEYNLETGVWRDMNLLSSSVTAGAQAYDLATGVACYLSRAVLTGSFQNLNNIEYLDFAQPWWAQHINKELTIGDRLYIASGFYDMPTVARVQVVFFSTEMAEKYSVDNLYDIVREGTWTYDTMIGMAESLLVDVDGNGTYDENDQYGLTSQWDVLGLAYGASGHSFTQRSSDGEIAFTEYDEALLAANDMIYDLLYNSDFYYSGYTKGGPHNYDNMVAVFTDNRALFMQNGIAYATDERLREMGTYGILPPPKFTAEQENYGAYTSCFSSGIPADAPNVERSAIVLEALNAVSYKDVLPAYYDIALSQKFLNDKDSVEMLDIVFENACCEFSYMFQGNWGAEISLSVGLNENYASWYASKMKGYNKYLAKMIQDVLDLPY